MNYGSTEWAQLMSADLTDIAFSEDITITEPIEIAKDVDIDLNAAKLIFAEGAELSISNGHVNFKNGVIEVADKAIQTTSADTEVTFNNVTITSKDVAVEVKGRSYVVVEDSEITSYGGSAAINVIGHGVAKANSSLTLVSGSIKSVSGYAVSVTNGSFTMTGGCVETSADLDAIYTEGSRAKVNLDGGQVKDHKSVEIEVAESVEEPSAESEPVEVGIKPEPKPEPQPEPKKPEPKPELKKPEPKKPEPKPEPKKPEPKNPQSGVVKSATVYGSPSSKSPRGTISGPVKIISTNHIDPRTQTEYVYVSYIVAGIGGRGVGYIKASALR